MARPTVFYLAYTNSMGNQNLDVVSKLSIESSAVVIAIILKDRVLMSES